MMCVAWFWQDDRPQGIVPAKPAEMIAPKLEILTASRQLDPGHHVTVEDAEWAPIPNGQAEAGTTTRTGNSDTPNPYIGRVVVEPVKAGQPLMSQNFLAKDGGNYIAGLLSPGKRAFAIVIDSKGSASAGNFILPNDYVDIIRSSNTNAGLSSEMILSNIRVLAIGSNIRVEGLSLAGETATVEVDIREAEILATAQRAGQISLALRRANDTSEIEPRSNNLVIIRPTTASEKSP